MGEHPVEANVTALLLAILSPALACSIAPSPLLPIEPDPSDTEPPLEPILSESQIARGRGPQGSLSTSCDDIGWIALTFEQPADDPHPADAVGYRLTLVSGDLPDGLRLSDAVYAGPQLGLHWIDGATDDQEPFSAEIEVVAVDVAGNEGPPAVFRLEDGQGRARCDTGGAVSGLWPLLVVALTRPRRSPRRSRSAAGAGRAPAHDDLRDPATS